MIKRISEWFYKSTSRAAALAALAVFVLFAVLVLPSQAGGGLGEIPDVKLFYTAEELYRLAESYGLAGREAFVKSHFTFDLAFPVVYTLFLVTAITRLLGRVLPEGSPWRLANLFPLGTFVLDMVENTLISLVVIRYPALTPGIDAAAGWVTLVKWAFAAASMAALFVGLFLVGRQKLASRPK